MTHDGCPISPANWPSCGCEDGECEKFDEFGMACDNCDTPGHRDAGGWRMNDDGSVWCEQCFDSHGKLTESKNEVGKRVFALKEG